MSELSSIISELEPIMKTLEQAEFAEAAGLGQRFFTQFFNLGLLLERSPTLRTSRLFEDFQTRWTDRIEMVMYPATALHIELGHELSLGHLMDLSPEQVCRLYSGGRFVYGLFGSDAFEMSRAFSEQDDYLEELSEALAAGGGVDHVPDGVPESHSWWWVKPDTDADELPPW